MRRPHHRIVLATALIAATTALPVRALAQPEAITVVVSPASVSVDLGADIQLTVEVTNNTDRRLTDLAIHIDITDPTTDGSVDPEDWVPTLTLQIHTLSPGQTSVLQWTLKPIAGGQFSVYAVVLQAGSHELHSSEAAIYNVSERRALNPKGVLPAAIGMPLLIGGILVARLRARRRSAAQV